MRRPEVAAAEQPVADSAAVAVTWAVVAAAATWVAVVVAATWAAVAVAVTWVAAAADTGKRPRLLLKGPSASAGGPFLLH
jgi:hypothetical protein